MGDQDVVIFQGEAWNGFDQKMVFGCQDHGQIPPRRFRQIGQWDPQRLRRTRLSGWGIGVKCDGLIHFFDLLICFGEFNITYGEGDMWGTILSTAAFNGMIF